MKKLTIIVPIYKTEQYIENNIDMGKKASKKFDVYFVQDGVNGTAESLAKKIKCNFVVKENGNGGSVINYAKRELEIKTDGITIVDADDKIHCSALEEAIKSHRESDLIIGRVNSIGSKKIETLEYTNHEIEVPFIHSMIGRTSLFLKTMDLPEGISFMDSLLAYDLYESSKSISNSNEILYDYFRDLPGQSTNPKLRTQNKMFEGFKIICDLYIEKAASDAVKGHMLRLLENVIWRTRDNKKYKKAYKSFWKSNLRGFFTRYHFMLIAGLFKRKTLDK